MQKILEKFMKKSGKMQKKTGKVREIRQSKKVGTMCKGQWRPFIQKILVSYILKNTGKLVVNTGKTQGI